MKNKLAPLFFLSFMLVALFSCTKKENKIYFEGGTAPALSATKTGTIPLSFATKDQEAVKFSWTNPDYKFTTGNSSQTVSYQVEIDTTGANFTNPNKKVVAVGSDLSITLTQNDLNDYLLNQLQLVPGMSHNIEVRVKSMLNNGAVPLFSNVLKFTAIPYAIPPKITPPSTGKLFLVGSATPGGWNNPVPLPSQEFTKLSPTLYQITVPITGGGSYLFLPLNGDWGVKYGANGANNSNNVNGDDLKQGGGDILAPAASGTYKIEVDFQRGKFTVTKL
ncbi:MAG TPA: SusE domain-containing protein [Chitinophagaceae bacterium]|nr:SusE domain-containing protein [Chitinophagaceae bacterium]